MVFCFTRVIGFLQVHVRILRHNAIANSDVGLHRAKRVLLLHEINPDVPFPAIRASLVQDVEVRLLAQCLQSKEDESSGKVRILLDNFEVNFIECPHVLAFIMHFH